MGLTSAQAEVQIVPTMRGFQSKVSAGVKGIRVDPIQVKINVDKRALAAAEAEVRAASQRLSRARDTESTATERVKLAEQKLAETRRSAAAGSSALIAAENRLAQAKRAGVSASSAAARANADHENSLKRVANAQRQLDASMKGNKGFRIDVDSSQILRAVSSSRSLRQELLSTAKAGAILTAAIAAIGSGGAAIAALPGLLASAASGIGVLVGAFSGVGDALKGYTADQDAAGKAATKTGSDAASNARQIRDAQASISDARQAATDTAVDGADRVRAANAAVVDAERNANATRIDGAKRVGQAQKDAAEVQVQGARQIRSAQEGVISANQRAADAQKDLSDAFKEATLAIRDQRLELTSSAISIEEAQLSLDRAIERQKELKAEGASALDLRDADLGVRRAINSLEEAKNRYSDLYGEALKSSQVGVQGADNVVAAQRGVADANKGVSEAERNLAETRADANKANLEAQGQVAEARAQAREDNIAAERDVATARADAAKVSADAARANQDAQKGIADAIQNLADVQAQQSESADTAAKSTSKFAEAMAKLTPEAQALVYQLLSMKPALDGLKQAAGENFLPGVVQMLKDSSGLFPILEENLRRTGAIMGQTARDFGSLFKSDEFKRDLDAMFKNAEPITRAIGNLFVGITNDIVKMGANTKGTQQGFADFLGSLQRGVSAFLAQLSTPEADKAFGELWRELGHLIEILLPIIADLAVWCAQKLVPAIKFLSEWLTRNKDDLGFYAKAILGVYLAIKALNIATGVTKWCQGIAGAISFITGDANKASDAVNGKKGLSKSLNALKTIGKIAVPIAIIWTLQEIADAYKAVNDDVQKGPDGKPVAPEQRNIKQAASQGLNNALGQYNANPLESLVPAKGDSIFSWFFGDTPENVANGIKNSLFGKLSEKFDATIGTWMTDNISTPFKNFFINLPTSIGNVSTGMGTWAETNIRQPVIQKASEIGSAVGGFFAGIPAWIGGLSDQLGMWAETNIREPVVRKLTEMKDGAIQKVTEAKDWVVLRFTELKDWVVLRATEAKDWVVLRFTELKDWVVLRATEAKDWVVLRFTELKDWVILRATEAKDWVVLRFTELKDNVILKATEAKDWVVLRFTELKDWVVLRATEAKDWVVLRFTELKDNVILKVTEAKDWVVLRFTELKDTVIQKVTEAKDWVVLRFTELKDTVIQKVTEAKDWVVLRFTELKDNVILKATEAKDWVVLRFTELKDMVILKATEAKDWVSLRFTELKDWIILKATEAKDWVVLRFTELKDTIIARVTEAKDWVLTRFTELKDGAIQKVTEAKDWVVTRATELKDGFVGKITELVDMVGRKWDELKGLFERPIRWVIDTVWNGAIGTLWGKARALLPGLPEFQRFASGGPVRGPGTATSDSIPARLSNNEHVWTSREVDAAGGHGYVSALRNAALSGNLMRFAGGGPVMWQDLWNTVKGRFPSATLNSSVRRGDPGEHGAGRAIDIGGPMMEINRWLAGAFPGSHELIHTPGINLFNGRPHTYNAQTRAGHFDHVHWANVAKDGSSVAGGVSGSASGLATNWLLDKVRDMYDAATNPLRGLAGSMFPGDTLVNRIPRDMVNSILDNVRGALFGAADMSGGDAFINAPGAGVERWRDLVLRALAYKGQPASLANTVLRRMNQESGGNPNIVNNWDSNARKGTPSGGLMQTIKPTFLANHEPGTSFNMFDPWANILASMNYAIRRYGSLSAAYNKAGGYALGGVIPGAVTGRDDKLVLAGSGERLLTERQNVAFEALAGIKGLHASSAVHSVMRGQDLAGVGSGSASRTVVGQQIEHYEVRETVDVDSAMSRAAFFTNSL